MTSIERERLGLPPEPLDWTVNACGSFVVAGRVSSVGTIIAMRCQGLLSPKISCFSIDGRVLVTWVLGSCQWRGLRIVKSGPKSGQSNLHLAERNTIFSTRKWKLQRRCSGSSLPWVCSCVVSAMKFSRIHQDLCHRMSSKNTGKPLDPIFQTDFQRLTSLLRTSPKSIWEAITGSSLRYPPGSARTRYEQQKNFPSTSAEPEDPFAPTTNTGVPEDDEV